ncbi:uncharacterized protein BXZ73DRAFT_106157 [Epithele typhae]|uniref:uncharacterized protein n=1 Tax=Epithele typhae TaxID=378194 RepID=UPI0020072CAF|nr:uncharacterized protein BXZ73DRAFT_106157 [Epithele typhae]KAH9915428.1 hypothetical protein BXZ73DRAFT_106157 [Epithele typhae]
MNRLNGLLSRSKTTDALPTDIKILPVGQLESLRFKTNQIVESIQLLQRTLAMGGANLMPPWPEILSKYNILLSQSHSLSMTLSAAHQASTAAQGNPYEKIVLAPRAPLSDAQVDGEFIHHLRTQPTLDVLRAENDAVRHLAACMHTKGSLGVLGLAPVVGPRGRGHPEYEDVLRGCEQIRVEHDLRVERATRAVQLLRDRYEWKLRVEVEEEEPEDWEPGFGGGGAEVSGGNTPGWVQSNGNEEEEELE